MNARPAYCAHLLAAVLAGAGASVFAQMPVVTDVGYAPPEFRESMGAVLVEDRMVMAQRQKFGQRSTPDEVQAIGREVIRRTIEQAQAQGDEGPITRALGGPPAYAPGHAPPARVIRP